MGATISSMNAIDTRSIAVVFFGLLSSWHLGNIVYNLFFHPLKKIPGPFLARCSPIFMIRVLHRRRLNTIIADLHSKFGPVVRIGPNELSFSTVNAQKKIYNSSNNNINTYFTKQWTVQEQAENLLLVGTNIITTHDKELHRKLKRGIQPAFTPNALKDQEPLIQQHVRGMIGRLDEIVQKPDQVTNIGDVISASVWELVSDLSFGDTLTGNGRLMFDYFINNANSVMAAYGLYDYLFPFGSWVLPSLMKPLGKLLQSFPYASTTTGHVVSASTLRNCLQRQHERRDFMTAILDHCAQTGFHLSDDELVQNSSILFLAGYGTTAMTMTATFYQLLRNPEYMAAVQSELRNAFPSQESITADGLAKLRYLPSVIFETLRLMPPINTRFADRTCPGTEINGIYIPKGTVVSANVFSMQRMSEYWAEPLSFRPERWFDNGPGTLFEHDNREAYKPFLSGTRGCIGKEMAYQTLRISLGHLLYRYDYTMVNTDLDWDRDVPSAVSFQRFKCVQVNVHPRKS
ncbi:cytochrome P450 [Bipolaris maydis]|nr:cytochrome P450 [Bipolaris maydis]